MGPVMWAGMFHVSWCRSKNWRNTVGHMKTILWHINQPLHIRTLFQIKRFCLWSQESHTFISLESRVLKELKPASDHWIQPSRTVSENTAYFSINVVLLLSSPPTATHPHMPKKTASSKQSHAHLYVLLSLLDGRGVLPGWSTFPRAASRSVSHHGNKPPLESAEATGSCVAVPSK